MSEGIGWHSRHLLSIAYSSSANIVQTIKALLHPRQSCESCLPQLFVDHPAHRAEKVCVVPLGGGLDALHVLSVIADLDAVLYDTLLGDYMLVSWESMAGMRRWLSGKPSAESPYEKRLSGRERLRVRSAIYPSSPREQTWGGVLHGMLHAYLKSMSEWHGLKQLRGPLFGVACTAMVRRLVLEGLKVHHVDGESGG